MFLYLQWQTLKKKNEYCAPLKSVCVILNRAGYVTCYFCPLYKTYAEI